MANLTPAHAAAIARLRAYVPPPTQYFSLPLSRRAAVLVLLYADRRGELRVVLTMRAKTLSSFAGQAALPGGKADSLSETPTQTARREAYEEIGLPLSNAALPPPYRIHHLCSLPINLARTELGVRPVVAWIEANPDAAGVGEGYQRIPAAEDVLIPRLDAREVAAVFTAPFEAFLEDGLGRGGGDETAGAKRRRSARRSGGASSSSSSPLAALNSSSGGAGGSNWYTGQWTTWNSTTWRMHNFYVPASSTPVTWAEDPPPAGTTSSSAAATNNSFRVFGMTARILVDAARVAFGREPVFEHNSHFGDEDMVGRLIEEGRMGEKAKRERGGGGVVVIGDDDGADDEGGQGSKVNGGDSKI